jgi:Ca2+-binding RTX toxin-like protein
MADIVGTPGNDTLVGTPDDDTVFAKGGDDRVIADSGNDTVNGGGGDDTIIGNDGDDELNGGGGNDTIRGDSGDDDIDGGGGGDIIFAGNGDDTVSGGNGSDTITGGRGSDEMSGGAGQDTFVFKLVRDFAGPDMNDDVVLDFTLGSDLLDFVDFDINTSDRSIASITSDGDDLVFLITMANGPQEKGTITLNGLGDEFEAAADKGAFINSLFVDEDQQFGDYFDIA